MPVPVLRLELELELELQMIERNHVLKNPTLEASEI